MATKDIDPAFELPKGSRLRPWAGEQGPTNPDVKETARRIVPSRLPQRLEKATVLGKQEAAAAYMERTFVEKPHLALTLTTLHTIMQSQIRALHAKTVRGEILDKEEMLQLRHLTEETVRLAKEERAQEERNEAKLKRTRTEDLEDEVVRAAIRSLGPARVLDILKEETDGG